MAAPTILLGEPLIQAHSHARRVGKVVALLSLIAGLSCAAIWAFSKDNQQVADIKPAASMAMIPGLQLPKISLPFMQPRTRNPVPPAQANYKFVHRTRSGAVEGIPERPRLTIHKSRKNLYAQLIDDESMKVVAAISSRSPELADLHKNKETARKMGIKLALMAKEKGIDDVVFDRHFNDPEAYNGFSKYRYHGIVAELDQSVRATLGMSPTSTSGLKKGPSPWVRDEETGKVYIANTPPPKHYGRQRERKDKKAAVAAEKRAAWEAAGRPGT